MKLCPKFIICQIAVAQRGGFRRNMKNFEQYQLYLQRIYYYTTRSTEE